MENKTIMQFFEWHIPNDGSHWSRLKEVASELKDIGITEVWIPPVTKGQSSEDTGYGVYDLFDLGEFNQKGTVRTKYGTKDELIAAINECHAQDLKVYVDLVLNHKAGADETETFKVVEVNPYNRTEVISQPFDIEGWTRFTFPGRNKKYSPFEWSFIHFTGTDYDNRTGKKGVFKILGDFKDWNDEVDEELGNYDYLMFADIDYNHPEVKEEVINAGKWIADTIQCDGYRLDAIKHIGREFIDEFVIELKKHRGDDFYFVGEFWIPGLEDCKSYLDSINYRMDLFDVALHYKLQEAANTGKAFDLTTIFNDTLVESYPLEAVTFVDNHDTQPGEGLESWIKDWFKQIAYSLILLRQEGRPVVFYGDYYNINGPNPIPGKKEAIDPLLLARKTKAYGEQIDYFDHPNVIGWVRYGLPNIEHSGCAVVISNSESGFKKMFVGEDRAGEEWVDMTNTRKDKIIIGKDGFAKFPVDGGSVSVWAFNQ